MLSKERYQLKSEAAECNCFKTGLNMYCTVVVLYNMQDLVNKKLLFKKKN